MALSLLGTISELNSEVTVEYIRKCRNFDGGFGSCEGGESHAAQGLFQTHLLDKQMHLKRITSPLVYVCLGTLAILNRLDEVDQPTLAWWLAERQLPNGGLNGRPEKLEDVGNVLATRSRHSNTILGLLQLLGPFLSFNSAETSLDRCRRVDQVHYFCSGEYSISTDLIRLGLCQHSSTLQRIQTLAG